MFKTFSLCSIILFYSAAAIWGEDYYRYLVNAQSMIGATGNISNPSPYLVPQHVYTVGLHRFIIGVNTGIRSSGEIGVNANLVSISQISKPGDSSIGNKNNYIIHGKYSFTKNRLERKDLNLACGLYTDRLVYQTLYLVAGREVSAQSNTIVQAGTDYSENKLSYFLTFIQPTKYSLFICEYRARNNESNFGWRVLLSRDVKLDIFIKSNNNFRDWFNTFIFGLTLATKQNAG